MTGFPSIRVTAILFPEWEYWADLASVLALLLTLVLVVLFYRRMLLTLRRAEQRQRFLLENAPFAVFVTHKTTGHFLFANRHTIKLLGLSPTEYTRQQIRYTNPAHSRDYLLRHLAATGHVEQLEVEVESYDGRRFHSIGSAALIPFDGVEAILCSFEDISTIKEAELQVRASEARLQAVFQAAPDGIVILSPDGLIRRTSHSCAALVGITDEGALIGRQILDFVEATDRAAAGELLATVGRAINPGGSSFKINRPDGTHVWIEPRAVPMTDPITGNPSIVLVLRNITQRREAQDALAAHAAELQNALNRIAHLQNEIVRVCAWTKEVEVDGQWIPIDHYLAKHLGLKISHGISEKGLEMLGVPPETPPGPPPTATGPTPSV